MGSKNRVSESIRCVDCDQPFWKLIYEEDLRCGSCVTKKYSDVFHFSINLDDRFREVLLGCLLFAFFGLLSPSMAMAEPISNDLAIKCIVAESGSEDLKEMTAIGEVMRNRNNSTQGIYGLRKVIKAERAWHESATSNLTDGATMWGNKGDVKKWRKESWFNKNMVETGHYGKHWFFKDKREVKHGT